MNLRQLFRENWDTGFILIAMAAILSWALTVLVILPMME
jgi:hypothetical protein